MILSGRKFTKKEIQLIKDTASLCTGISVNELAFTICELLDWKSANGKLKVDSCLKALQKLKEAGEIEIKERKRYARRRKSGIVITERSAPGQNISCGIPDLGGLRFVQVVEDSDKSLWNELLDRYHYIGVKRKFGDTLQFFVKDKYQRILACIEYSPASISLEKRDRWIGWTKEQRQVNIKLVVNNSRFLVLPWVKVKNLSSKILSESLKILPDAWEKQFAYRPVLAETFVDSDKHHGGCYIAANWKGMGLSKGRGRNDCDNQKNLSLKKIFVMPMQDDFRRSLLGEKEKEENQSEI